MMTKIKTIITGGTGLLGSAAPLVMKNEWQIELWTRGHEAKFENVESSKVNLENYESIYERLSLIRPDVVIHAAGLTNIEECENNSYSAYLSNVLTTKNIAKACSKLGIKFVFISTDQVLTDQEGSLEDAIAFPVNVYAKTKLEGEFETLRFCPDALVVRVNFFTWGSSYRKSFLDFIVDSLREGKKLTLFEDVRFNPLSAEILLKSLDVLVRKNASGIFNVVGDERLTKYEFGLKVADVFALDGRLIQKGALIDNKKLVKRPRNLTLDNSKVKQFVGANFFPSIDSTLRRLSDQEKMFKESFGLSLRTPSSAKIIQYGRQTIEESDVESILSCLNGALLTQGPKVAAFEKSIANYVGARYAVAMCNWTAGLHMAMLASHVSKGDNVITSPLSFVASSNCILYAGANPHFVDIDPQTLNLDVKKLEQKCKELGNVKAIIPVHFAGAPCDMIEISRIAKQYGAMLVEDAAHALGGRYLCGKRIGNPVYSDMVGFSFHPVKNITTGEGGAITTNDESIYKSLLRLRSHGINKVDDTFLNKELAYTNGMKNQWYYEMQDLGYNFRITDLQCSLGLSQMLRIDKFHSRRVEIAKHYDSAFSSLKNLKVLQNETRDLSGNHLYVVRIDFDRLNITRQRLFELFMERDIQLHVHYIPITKQPYYKNIVSGSYPAVDDYYEHATTLPLYVSMTDDQINHVINSVKSIIG
jgi:perosamine synthetase